MGRARTPDSAQQSVCLSCHDEHLSCPQSVWEEFLFPQLRRAGGGRGGKNWGLGESKVGCMKGKRRWRERKEGLLFAHRLMGLCAGPDVGLSGPLAFLCSLALGNTQTHTCLKEMPARTERFTCFCEERKHVRRN